MQHFLDMILMFGHVIQVNKNVVKVNYYTDVRKIGEDIVYELLKGYRSISEAKRHYYQFKESIASIEGSFLPYDTYGKS